MKIQSFTKASLLIICLLCASASAQGIFDKFKNKINEKTKQAEKVKEKAEKTAQENLPDDELSRSIPAADLAFARIEVSTNWTEKGEKVYETRVYYSKLLSLPRSTQSRNYKEQLIEYFTEGVVEQLKKRGIEANFYDNQVQIFPHSYSFESREEAEAEMNKKIEVDKSNERAIYNFVWKFGAKDVSEEITQPKRIFGIKTPPSSETK